MLFYKTTELGNKLAQELLIASWVIELISFRYLNQAKQLNLSDLLGDMIVCFLFWISLNSGQTIMYYLLNGMVVSLLHIPSLVVYKQ